MEPQPQMQLRFMILGADNMLELLKKMLQYAHPFSRCIYFGKNEGDYSLYPDQELVKRTSFIAVFDMAPVQIFEAENVQIITNNDDSDGSDGVLPENKITLSA